jgi:hypothetical protein
LWGLSWQEEGDKEDSAGGSAEAAGRAPAAKVERAEWGSLLSGRQWERLMPQRWHRRTTCRRSPRSPEGRTALRFRTTPWTTTTAPSVSDTRTRTSQVERARVDGCGALTITTSPSVAPSRSGWAQIDRSRWRPCASAAASDVSFESKHPLARRARTVRWCPHIISSDVMRPSSVGREPVSEFSSSFSSTNAVSSPSSVGSVPVNSAERTSLPATPLPTSRQTRCAQTVRSVHHSRFFAPTFLAYRRCEVEHPFKGEEGGARDASYHQSAASYTHITLQFENT